MRVNSRLLSLTLAVHLLALPCFARADDAAQADPFRPVQPSWDATETRGAADPGSQKAQPASANEENEQFLFDETNKQPVAVKAEPIPEAPAAASGEPVAPATEPPPNVDLHAPHVWMATGAIVLGVSFLAALVIATQLDKPALAGATVGIGGLLGIAGLSVGVIMQNQRLEAAGQRVPPALPNGISLSLAFSR